MNTWTFVCTEGTKGTSPCSVGRKLAEAMGIPKDQQTCHCEKFVGDMQRKRGLSKRHTCVRELGDAGHMYVSQDQPKAVRIEVRLAIDLTWEQTEGARLLLEEHFGSVMFGVQGDPGEVPSMPLPPPDPCRAVTPPPENVEEPTQRIEPPRQGDLPPVDAPPRAYRGPLPEEQVNRPPEDIGQL